MAATVTIDSGSAGRFVQGNKLIRTGTINLGTYTSGGIAVTAAMFEMPAILHDLYVESAGGYVFRYDKTNKKVMAYMSAGSAAAMGEVGSTDISAAVARFKAEGS